MTDFRRIDVDRSFAADDATARALLLSAARTAVKTILVLNPNCADAVTDRMRASCADHAGCGDPGFRAKLTSKKKGQGSALDPPRGSRALDPMT